MSDKQVKWKLSEGAIHPDAVSRVLAKLPEDAFLYDLAELFKVFGDSTRMKVLYTLLEEELCVSDIASALQLSPSAVSHQLRILKQSKLVKFRRSGKVIYYSLDDDHIRSILETGAEHVEEGRI
ncbi:MAG: winged helix-turn-helix transcriptional regulator [Oscillospiraceae bacterium]|nr:winged helix-turn-helix transcriptional regulator [Oscillospiraceae bacterium]